MWLRAPAFAKASAGKAGLRAGSVVSPSFFKEGWPDNKII